MLNGELELGRFIPAPTRISPTKIAIKAAKKKAFGRKSTIEIIKNTKLIVKTIKPPKKILISILLIAKTFFAIQI